MSKREPLKSGDRCCIEYGGKKIKGVAVETCGGLGLRSNENNIYLGPKLKRLVHRKKPCPPQGERVERWMYREEIDKAAKEWIGATAYTVPQVKGSDPWPGEVHLVELKPGEAIVQSNELFLHLTRQLDFAHNSVGAEIIRNALKPKQGSAK